MAMLQITTTPSTVKPAANMLRIEATKRSTEKNPCPDNLRYRGVDVPEFTPNVPDKFINLVSSALVSLAESQLADLRDDTDPQEVDAELFTEDALLAYSATKAQGLGRLTKEAIAEWFAGSMLRKFIVAKFDEKRAKKAGIDLQSLASAAATATNFDEDRSLRTITLMGSVEEPESDTMRDRLIAVLQRHVDKIRAQRDAIGATDDVAF